jgi:hypothetical protein
VVEKKTISLQSHVLQVAQEKADLFYGGSLSGYINWLICNDCVGEIKKALVEEKKPVRDSKVIKARMQTLCKACNEYIEIGDDICLAKFEDGWSSWVHKNCSKP